MSPQLKKSTLSILWATAFPLFALNIYAEVVPETEITLRKMEKSFKDFEPRHDQRMDRNEQRADGREEARSEERARAEDYRPEDRQDYPRTRPESGNAASADNSNPWSNQRAQANSAPSQAPAVNVIQQVSTPVPTYQNINQNPSQAMNQNVRQESNPNVSNFEYEGSGKAERLKKERQVVEYQSEDLLKSTLEEGRLNDEHVRVKKISGLNLEVFSKDKPQVTMPGDESYQMSKTNDPSFAHRPSALDSGEREALAIEAIPASSDLLESSETLAPMSSNERLSSDKLNFAIMAGKSMYIQDYQPVLIWGPTGQTWVKPQFTERFSLASQIEMQLYKRLAFQFNLGYAKGDAQLADQGTLNNMAIYPNPYSNGILQNMGIVNLDNSRYSLGGLFNIYLMDRGNRVAPYIGVGPELILDQYRSLMDTSFANATMVPNPVPNMYSQEASTVKFAGQFALGMNVNISPSFGLHAKANYRYLAYSQQATSYFGQLLLQQEPRHQLQFLAGLSFNL